ncbi:WD repeat, SAM and U-box domain-containing protein 1 isoform 1, partial [Reticulomyxa filosa]
CKLQKWFEESENWIEKEWNELEKRWSTWNSQDISIFVGYTLKCNKLKMNEYNKIIKGKKINGMSLLTMSKNDWMDLFHFDMFLQVCVVYDSFNQICVKYPIDSNEGIPHDIPKEYLCPLSKSIMKDPVIAPNGITYDRLSIMNQYQNIPNYYSLMNDGNLELYPDFALKQKIQKFLENLK